MRGKYSAGALLCLLLISSLTGCVVDWQYDLQAQGSESAQAPATQTVVPSATAAPDVATPTAPPSVTVQPGAADLQSQVMTVYASAAPAVVNITSRVLTYEWFSQPMPTEGTGSGFVYDDQGHIVTNYHVVADADEITVSMADGAVYVAEVVGEDASTDLAVLRIDADTLPSPLPLADSDQLAVGQFVVAIGNPFGLDQTLTFGVISSLGRVIETPNSRFVGEAIQTDAPINPGNSGGPLLDLQGRVIGVNSQIISPTQASAGIGFAVSSNSVRRVVPQLIANGRFPHPWLGATLLALTPDRVAALNRLGADLAVEEGVLILYVESNSPAERSGLRGGSRTVNTSAGRIPVGGDVIIALGDTPIASDRDLRVYLDTQTHVGDEVLVTFVRDGDTRVVNVPLAARPE